MRDLESGHFAAPLSIHTSSGVPEALEAFVDALEPHLPSTWRSPEPDGGLQDWCVSLQLEGASAVWAGVDMLLQVSVLSSRDRHRKKVAVGDQSYHGPPSTSLGGRSPLWDKAYQVKYPVPTAGQPCDEDKLLDEFDVFLRKHGNDVGVILIEPQWGSSQTALPWPETLLKEYIKRIKVCGIKVLCDEIMCGLGRHGKGTLFLSDAWDLDPDCVTFGKSIAGGVFPLSGAVIKSGRDVLGVHGRSVMQSHTFAGSSARSLMMGVEVLKELPLWFPSISKLGEELSLIFKYLESMSRGMIKVQGQGLMWGCLFTFDGIHRDDFVRAQTVASFKRNCEGLGVLPYFVPVGGFMVTPVIDVDVGTIYEIGQRLEAALKRTIVERVWKDSKDTAIDQICSTTFVEKLNGGFIELANVEAMKSSSSDPILSDSICSPQLHVTRSCTSCSSFVCLNLRTRFLQI